MDTQTLTAFITVAETGSFSLAGERLHLTQPAVSKRVAALEEQLDTRLFDRIGRAVHLTEAGRLLLPRARQILESLAAVRQQLADLSGQVRGTLTLATSHHIGLHRLPPALRDFSRRYPEVTLDLHFLASESAYQEVNKGVVELAVITLGPETETGIRAIPLWDDPLAFVVSPRHPLAAMETPLSLADLAPYPAILPEPTTWTTRLVRQLFDRQGVPLRLSMATNYLETIRMMVSVELGWSVLPHTLLNPVPDHDLQGMELQQLAMQDVSLHRQLGVIHHRNRSLSNAARAFIDRLIDASGR